jgi:putative component of toxin-antitoxin plasmid stabilization module
MDIVRRDDLAGVIFSRGRIAARVLQVTLGRLGDYNSCSEFDTIALETHVAPNWIVRRLSI